MIKIWDESDQFSVISLVSQGTRENLIKRKAEQEYLFNLDEFELHKELNRLGKRPNTTDHRMRLRFWSEYDLAMSEYRRMENKKIVAGSMSGEFYLNHYLKNPYRVSWMMCVPTAYDSKMSEGLSFALDQMRGILDAEMFDEDGKLDVKVASLKVAIYKILDDRSNGMALQKVETKSLNLRAEVSGKELRMIQELSEKMSMEDLKKKLDASEKREKKSLNMVDITPVMVSSETVDNLSDEVLIKIHD